MKVLTIRMNLLILLLAALFFVPCLGLVNLFDWDEINFAECAREMIVSGNYMNLQMNFSPFWEKPPLFIWMQALSMKMFGINEFSARFPNAIAGIATLIIIFNIGKKLYDQKMGLLWVLAYAGSILPQFYFRSGIIDPWFNLFIFSGFYFFLAYAHSLENGNKRLKYLIVFACLTGLAVLTKGPAALVIIGLCLGFYYLLQRFRSFMPLSHILILLGGVLLSGGLWFILLFLQGKQGIIEHFISYQVHLFRVEDSGHGGPFYYHFIVLLFGCFPASFFAIRSLKRNVESGFEVGMHFHRGMQILFWVVLILFSVVQTKIIHYSSLCYFPLTYMAARSMHRMWNGEMEWKRWMTYLIAITGTLLGLAFTILPFIESFKSALLDSGMIKDEMAIANLKAQVKWQGFEWISGLVMLVAIFVGLWAAIKKNYRIAILTLFGGSLISTQMVSLMIVPKIEAYTQRAVIDFYRSVKDEDCYVESLNYLSYAQYFYAQKGPFDAHYKHTREWLLHGKTDKDVYFVSKITLDQENREDNPEMLEIARKNGFIFYRRPVPK